MSDKKLTVLGIIAVIAAALAVMQSRMNQQTASVEFGRSPLIAGLNIEAVSAIKVTSQNGSQTVTLSQQGGQFVVADKDNYPADVAKINLLISNCLDIRVAEKITSNPANHADLKVTPETAEYMVAFLDSTGEPIVTLVLSPSDDESGTSHGRLLKSDDVYLIQNRIYFNVSPMQYIDAELVDIRREDVNSVAVKNPEGNYLLKAGQGNDEVVLEDMPEGKQFKGTDYKTVFGALAALRFEDVQAEKNAPADLEFNYNYIGKLKDLKVYKLSLAKKDDAVYAKVSATYLDSTPVEKTVGEVESDEELKKKEQKLLAIDAVKEFTARHKGWIYKIPAYKADNLIKPLSELIEDIPAPEPEESPVVEEKTTEQASL